MKPTSKRETTNRPAPPQGWRTRYRDVAQNPLFSYVTIFLLQLKIVWGMWHHRDLTAGDTASYFVAAYGWLRVGMVSIAWSPLYTSFYGSLQAVSSDAFFTTLSHRLIVVLVLAIVVLALMRKLLPPDIAWFATAWWVAMPINFESLYEVHLYAALPVLCAALAIVGKPTPWRHGWALALMLVGSVLMRNELLLATGLLAVALIVTAIWKVRIGAGPPRLTMAQGVPYAIPLASACLLIAFYYQHANDAGYLLPVMARKHTLNICQTYAFGYQQRHNDFTKSAWTECQELMMRTYGTPEPPLVEAFSRNPSAMLEHFYWNLGLIPSGIQVALFGATSGKISPDYVPVTSESDITLVLSVAWLAILAAGAFCLGRNWRPWWDQWLKDRAWGWILLLAAGCVTFGVMISQRPRPSYLFAFAILLRAATGMSLYSGPQISDQAIS